jgi:predicted HTH transcriptional regulator
VIPLLESQTTEFKKLWKDEYLKTITAFANTDGGTLWIGIDDDGSVFGVGDTKELLDTLPNKINNRLGIAGLPSPQYRYSFGAVQVTFHKTETTPITTPVATPITPKITREELAIALDISINGIKQHILKLKKDGILKRIGDNRNGYWDIDKK